ncbi:hypothetical protein O0L34_g2605 [Tuta absoluta]|nr:hypothetical protein O0L34_g2605 [Tuta absoluta]
MPRTYKPDPTKKNYKKYDPNIISAALEDLEKPHASLMEIAAKYNIHKSVLYRHSKKIMKPQGGQTALSEEAELNIIQNINKCAEWGYPMDTMDLRFIVKMYLDKLGVVNRRFKNNFPGVDFVQSFLKRHKQKISQRICENIKRARAAVSPDVIRAYFNELEKSVQGVELANIVNYDETNLSDDPGRKKVIMKRGCKYPERVINHSKSSVSIMMAGSADGQMLPPYVVYKAQSLYDTWVLHGPRGAVYNNSKSGWFEGSIFEDWVQKIAIPYFRDKPGRKILIGDNLSSHLSVSLITLCKGHDIDFVFLPPNSTHLTQPLDVAFFRPMKRAWRELLLKWKKTDGQTQASVPKGCFPKLLKLLIEHLKHNAENNLLAGFKKTGISPLNIDEILSRLPNEQNGDDVSSAINDSVIELLKQMRYGTMNVTEPKKKKKLAVVAGKSVTAEDVEKYLGENGETEAAKKSKLGKKKGKGKGKAKTQENKELLNLDKAKKDIQGQVQESEIIKETNELDPETGSGSLITLNKKSQYEDEADQNPKSKRKLDEVAGTSKDTGNNFEAKNETVAAKKSKFTESTGKGKGKGKTTKSQTLQEKNYLNTESNQEIKGLENEHKANKNNQEEVQKVEKIEDINELGLDERSVSSMEFTEKSQNGDQADNINQEEILVEVENVESVDRLKYMELDLNSMPFIFVESECEVITECQKDTEERKSCDMKFKENITKQANIKFTEGEKSCDIKFKKNSTNKTNKKITQEEKSCDIKFKENSTKQANIKLEKMNKVTIISNKKANFTQKVDIKRGKQMKLQDVIKVPTAKKTEDKNVNYYNNSKEIFKVLTDSD